jgi:hypothetical protein
VPYPRRTLRPSLEEGLAPAGQRLSHTLGGAAKRDPLAAAARSKSAGATTMDIGYYGNLFLPDWPTDATVTSAAKGTPGDGSASGS